MNNELGIVQLEYLHAAAKANLHEPGMAALYEALDMAIEALRSSEPKTADSGSVDSEMPEVKTDRTTSGDLINRQDAINAFEPEHSQDWYTPYIIETLESLPSAQTERKKGEWIIYRDCEGKSRRCTCSLCGHTEYSWENPNYCENCGAEMIGDTE